MTFTRVKQLLKRFKDCKVVVLGDMVLDEYLYGESSRISREAPVLILKHEKSVALPGGAANPTSNIHSMGAQPYPIGVVGKDLAAQKLLSLFKKKKIAGHLVQDSDRPTLHKTRIMAGGHNTSRQQIVRMDYVSEELISEKIEKNILKVLEAELKNADALLVSDYGSGLITPGILRFVNSLAKRKPRLVTVVDSRYQLTKYRHMWAATPNETEAAPAAGYEEYREADLEKIGDKLLKTTKSKMIMVTRGSKGMTMFRQRRKSLHVPPYGSTKIVDVNGAGDTVTAALTLALAAGAKPEEAMAIANAAGGVAVMKAGPASVSPKQILANIRKYL